MASATGKLTRWQLLGIPPAAAKAPVVGELTGCFLDEPEREAFEVSKGQHFLLSSASFNTKRGRGGMGWDRLWVWGLGVE